MWALNCSQNFTKNMADIEKYLCIQIPFLQGLVILICFIYTVLRVDCIINDTGWLEFCQIVLQVLGAIFKICFSLKKFSSWLTNMLATISSYYLILWKQKGWVCLQMMKTQLICVKTSNKNSIIPFVSLKHTS